MLYQWDISKEAPDTVEQQFWRNQRPEMPKRPWRRKPEPLPEPEPVDEATRLFAKDLFIGAVNDVEEIDRAIRRHAEHWRPERMAVVDRNILRMAIFEMTRRTDTDAAVVINEALEIARRFSDEESVGFINGVLDSIRKDAKAEPPAA